jgi:hypothetical protein
MTGGAPPDGPGRKEKKRKEKEKASFGFGPKEVMGRLEAQLGLA